MTWRQQRTAYLTTAVVLGGLALVLLVNGLAMHRDYTSVGLSSCGPINGPRCQVPLGLFKQDYQGWAMYFPRFVMFVPGLLGAFVGAPLVAREVESGTYRFAWTQARSRTTWLAAKIILVIVPITAAALAFSLIFGWWFRPFEPLMGRMAIGQAYELSGTVFAAHTSLAVALGFLVGAVLRRVVAAIATTLAVWVAITYATLIYLRPLIQQPLDVRADSSLITRGGWTISEYFRGPDGVRVASKGSRIGNLYLQATHDGVHDSKAFLAWLGRHGYTSHAIYQPESRFWHFQLVESAGYVAVSVLLIVALFWWVQRRIG